MTDINRTDTVGFIGRINVFVLKSFAEHIVEVPTIQMIGCGEGLRFRIENDASLRTVVLHLNLHAGVTGSGGDE